MVTLADAKRIMEELFGATDYQNCLTMWRRTQRTQLPFLGELDAREKVVKRDYGIIDNTAWRADLTFAGGMASGSVPQTVEWFDLRCDEMEEDQNLKALLQDQRDMINHALNKSNFYSSMYSAYLELPFGQAPRGSFFIPTIGMVYENYPVGTYAYALDSYNEVAHFCVKKDMSLNKIISKFGIDSLPDNLQQKAKEKRSLNAQFKVYWLVTRNPDFDRAKLGAYNKEYLSLYWLDCSKGNFVHMSGFDTCPITVMRFLAISNSDYGIGPAWFADSDVRIMYDMLRAAAGNMELFYNMPLQAPVGVDVDYRPGAVTTITNQGKVEALLNLPPVFDRVFEKAAEREQRINAAYCTNLFAMLQQEKYDEPHRTAYEWSLRQQEKMQQLTPVITRINNEVLGRDIKRVYSIFQENGVFNTPPEYDGLELDIEYISPLAKLQRMSGAQDYEAALAAVGAVAQLKPEVVGRLNDGVLIKQWIDSLGAKANILYTDEQYEEIMAEQQQAQQQQMMEQQAMQAAQQLPNITKAAENLQNMSQANGNSLDAIMQGLGREQR